MALLKKKTVIVEVSWASCGNDTALFLQVFHLKEEMKI